MSQCLDIYVIDEVITPVSLAPTWHHTWLLQYHLLYSLCCTSHPCDYFYNWQFVLNSFTFFTLGHMVVIFLIIWRIFLAVFILFIFLNFYLLILEWEMKRRRESDWCVVPFMYAFIGWFSYVFDQGSNWQLWCIESTLLTQLSGQGYVWFKIKQKQTVLIQAIHLEERICSLLVALI